MSSFKYELIDPKSYARVAAEEVVATIQDNIAEKGRCLIALAGGSTPVSIYRDLTIPPYVDQIEWQKLDLIFGDERWVPKDDVLSNCRMVNENLISRLGSSRPRVHPVNTAMETPQQAAANYGLIVSSLCDKNPKTGAAEIDLVLLGMGDDGHMASLFPGSKTLEQDIASQSMTSVEDWPGKEGAYRISLTPKALLSAKKIVFFVKGKSKADMLFKALDDSQAASIPVHIFRQVKHKVRWLVDSEAGIELVKLEQE